MRGEPRSATLRCYSADAPQYGHVHLHQIPTIPTTSHANEASVISRQLVGGEAKTQTDDSTSRLGNGSTIGSKRGTAHDSPLAQFRKGIYDAATPRPDVTAISGISPGSRRGGERREGPSWQPMDGEPLLNVSLGGFFILDV
ncbi:uncharacterized protein SPSK_06689 [Sporothrix schenckii 1099-18]|uniref:Uncharacterized protein n=1 Tax=Sporothrix schenckii 1099-18 TaxID=1397361 RepID=A0A0F2ML62_SPOSC|nr:uncharacterized protein SPSK_06689 [Sporothrix schenckii 1099-18]KJR89560.1 hypothetical protein SPSK_06689 [Sporothrix schenckii 1099-18]